MIAKRRRFGQDHPWNQQLLRAVSRTRRHGTMVPGADMSQALLCC